MTPEREAELSRRRLTARIDPTGETWAQVREFVERYSDRERDRTEPDEGAAP